MSRKQTGNGPVAHLTTIGIDFGESRFGVRVEFERPVVGFDKNCLEILNGRLSDTGIHTILDGLEYCMSVCPISPDRVAVKVREGCMTDVSGRSNKASEIWFDNRFYKPTVSINAPAIAGDGEFQVIFAFSIPVKGFHADCIVTSNARVTGFSGDGGNQIYLAWIMPDGEGDIAITVPADSAANSISAGNAAASATVIRQYSRAD